MSPTLQDLPVRINEVVIPVGDDPAPAARIEAPAGRFSGHCSTYDHTNRVIVSNRIELWSTGKRCGMTCRPLLGDDDDPGERIEFDDRRIVWAFGCMMRLMLRQGTITGGMGDT